jgi:co-chaperonin GroES (HSP10)
MHDFLDQDGTKMASGNQISTTGNLFIVTQRNIYFFKDNQSQTYFSPNDYILAKKIEVEQLKSSFLFIPENETKQFKQNKVVLHSSSMTNKNLTKDTIATTDITLGAPFYINEEEFLLFREKHFFAIN